MKQKKNNNKRKFDDIYLRRIRIHVRDLAFDLTTPDPEVDIGLIFVEPNHYEFKFSPPIDKIYATSSTLSVTHVESKRRDTVLTLLPHTDDKCCISLASNLNYIEFPTHTVKIEEQHVEELFLSLDNVQMRGDVTTPILNASFNYGVGFFQRIFGKDRYEHLPFFPPNVEFNNQPINLAKIPQKYATRKASKSGGGIQSSRVAKLLGYYQEPINGGNNKEISGWRSVAMRFGKLSEPLAILIYLSHHPEYKFKETGWHYFKNSNDGAMPDGVIQHGDNNEFLVEFKSSKFSTNFEGSHVAQCIWEMAVGETYPMEDLVHLSETRIRQGNESRLILQCKKLRIYRSEELEQRVIELAKRSNLVIKDYKEFLKLVNSPPYVEIREELDNIAKLGNTTKAEQIPIPEDLVQQYYDYKKEYLDSQDQDVLTLHPILDRIEKRQARLFAMFQDKKQEKQFKLELCDQIRDYAELIKE